MTVTGVDDIPALNEFDGPFASRIMGLTGFVQRSVLHEREGERFLCTIIWSTEDHMRAATAAVERTARLMEVVGGPRTSVTIDVLSVERLDTED